MSVANFFQFVALIAVIGATIFPLGRYIAKVFGSEKNGRAPGDRVFGPLERRVYWLLRIDPETEQTWKAYALSLIAFSLVSCVVLYAIQRLQAHMPFNPTHVGAVSPHLSFNTATSFVTNTNWQSYGGENTMSHLTHRAQCGLGSRPRSRDLPRPPRSNTRAVGYGDSRGDEDDDFDETHVSLLLPDHWTRECIDRQLESKVPSTRGCLLALGRCTAGFENHARGE